MQSIGQSSGRRGRKPCHLTHGRHSPSSSPPGRSHSDSLFGDGELGCDLLVAVSAGDRLENLKLVEIGREVFGMNDWFSDGAMAWPHSSPWRRSRRG
ncbi:hypothetical protein SBA4_7890002 [Candidatus Sulfopaludibacter sp. SbA4]|nr:hypothetical protein SBA4_7890002 [Candidatus Sulfopaludibacter sp. SbA4]